MFELRKYLKSFFYKASPYTQAGQDLFAYEQFGYNGTYIDIGAGEPQRGNNCYMLEVQKNWRGFSVEFGDSDQEKRDALKVGGNNILREKIRFIGMMLCPLITKKGCLKMNLIMT